MFFRDTPLAEPRADRRGPEVPAPPRKSANRARDDYLRMNYCKSAASETEYRIDFSQLFHPGSKKII